ncbi:MAG: cytochrome P450 [Gammaproteobacteria bacterium]
MDDFINWLATKYPFVVNIVSKVTWLRHLFSNYYINKYAGAIKPRPHAFTLASSYTSWKSLTDKTFTARHLPETDKTGNQPDIKKIVDLWRRRDNKEIPSADTSMLFSFFAQWFTDSFLRTDFRDRRKNTSNHEIDLCQLYGLNEDMTSILRSKEKGKLKHQIIDGEVYPPYLFNVKQTTTDNWVFASTEFEKLHPGMALKFIFSNVPEERLKRMFAVGLEQGNSTIGYTALNTIMLREHNRVCDQIIVDNPEWDDERLFQTARNIMIVLLLKIVLQDYIGHIAIIDFPFDPSLDMPEKKQWYRSNWVSLEFNLLYRWHSMVPEIFTVGNLSLKQDEFRSNTPLVTKLGVGTVISAASRQTAGRIGLYNSPDLFFEPIPIGTDQRSVMERTIDMARNAKLQSFNDYRDAFSLPRLKQFEELTDDIELQIELKNLYNNDIDELEWHVGIFAEKHLPNAMFGELMTHMVAYDAFTHALTNPLLSKNVFNKATFSETGLSIINNTNKLEDIIKRNTKNSKFVVANFNSMVKPPGNYGFPIIGVIYDTIDFLFLSGWKNFFLKRQEKYQSSVFKINLFMKTIAILDYEAFEPLFNWDGRLKKDYGFGAAIPPKELVGGIIPSVFQHNPEHQKYKSLYISILKNQVSTFEKTFNTVFTDYSEQWLAKGQFNWAVELERMSVAFVFEWYFGSQPDIEKVRFLYNNIFSHKKLMLLKLIPWSDFNKSRPLFEALLDFVKSSEGFKKHIELAKSCDLYDEDAIAKQILFLTGMNNVLGLQCFSKSLIAELSLHPDLRKELLIEMREVDNSAAGKLSLSALNKLPKLDNTLKEVLRLHPPVFFIHGRAEKDFALRSKTGSFAIAKGDNLMGVIPLAQLDPDAFADPESFSPERFSSPGSSKKLIWPHGSHNADVSSSGHICPGKNVAIEFGRVLCQALLNGFDWELVEKPTWSDKKYSLNVASPVGLMKTTKFNRRV